MCSSTLLFINCDKDDDSPEEASCDPWFEGSPCEALTAKFVGNYVGRAGFCGLDYEYTIVKTPDVVHGITIGINTPGYPTTYTFNALLTNSTDFNISLQEVFFQGQSAAPSLAMAMVIQMGRHFSITLW